MIQEFKTKCNPTLVRATYFQPLAYLQPITIEEDVLSEEKVGEVLTLEDEKKVEVLTQEPDEQKLIVEVLTQKNDEQKVVDKEKLTYNLIIVYKQKLVDDLIFFYKKNNVLSKIQDAEKIVHQYLEKNKNDFTASRLAINKELKKVYQVGLDEFNDTKKQKVCVE